MGGALAPWAGALQGPYDLILADPPWLYDDARTHASAGMARSAYECMPTDRISGMPVFDLAAPRCALAMWATCPKLPDALAVMHGWGFRYCTVAFVWVKLNKNWPTALGRICNLDDSPAFMLNTLLVAGLGHYTRSNVELVLLGRRGKALPRQDKTVRQVILAPRGKHSQKPPEVRNRLVSLFGPALRRAELFARDRAPGWDGWGLEYPEVQP